MWYRVCSSYTPISYLSTTTLLTMISPSTISMSPPSISTWPPPPNQPNQPKMGREGLERWRDLLTLSVTWKFTISPWSTMLSYVVILFNIVDLSYFMINLELAYLDGKNEVFIDLINQSSSFGYVKNRRFQVISTTSSLTLTSIYDTTTPPPPSLF